MIDQKCVLFRGGCDVKAAYEYIKKNNNIEIQSVFRSYHRVEVWNTSLSLFLKQAACCYEVKNRFVDVGLYPNKDIFTKKYANGAIIFSLIGDGMMGLYENVLYKNKLMYGYFPYDATAENGKYYIDQTALNGGYPDIAREEYISFAEQYKFLGQIAPNESVENYKTFIKAMDPTCKKIIFLGPTIENPYGEWSVPMQRNGRLFYKQLNNMMRNEFSSYDNVYLIDPNVFYKQPQNKYEMFYYNFPSILHYPCYTYYCMAQEISKITNGLVEVDENAWIQQQIRRGLYK